MKQEKLESAIMECYCELFKNSSPSADFTELVKTAKLNEFGQKEIPFMDYSIEEAKYTEIVSSIVHKYKIPKHLVQRFNTTIALGCSPKFKK